MWHYLVKVLVTAIVVVAVSELAKRSSVWGALLASLPLTSVLAFVWLHLETGNSARIAELSHSIFWLVLPSLLLFLVLPVLLKAGWGFWPSLAAASAVTAGSYALAVWWMTRSAVQG
jgi:hypothetical protein